MTNIETKLKHDTLTEKGRRHVGSKTPGEAGTHTRLEHVPPNLKRIATKLTDFRTVVTFRGSRVALLLALPDTTGPSFVGHSSNVCSRKFIVPRSGMHRCCPTNGSQLLVARNSGLVRRVLQFQPCFRAGSVRLPLDQNISHVVRSHNFQNLQTCKLPTTFASHSEKAILFLWT